MLAQPVAREVLHLVDEVVAGRAVGDDERLDDLPAQCIGHADHGRFDDIGMLEHRVLDLDRAHRPAGGDDHVVGAAAVIEVAVLVDLGRDPWWSPSRRGATASARRSRPARRAFRRRLHLDSQRRAPACPASLA